MCIKSSWNLRAHVCAGLRYKKALEAGGIEDDVILSLFGASILQDHREKVTHSMDDVVRSAELLACDARRMHLADTAHAEGRWASWYSHALRWDRAWHTQSGS
jgi:hypothetical protein